MELLELKRYTEVRSLLCEVEPADIAAVLGDMSERATLICFRLLPNDLAAEVFVELDSDLQSALIASFSDSELKEVIDELYVDDVVDLIEEMPANMVRRILSQAESDMRASINEILKYPSDSAGSLMTTEFVSLHSGITVSDAFSAIRRRAIDKETVYNCYVRDEKSRLIGVVTVKDLLIADLDDDINSIMETNIICAATTDDRETVALKFSHYDLLALPVVDSEGRLVGIITVDDAIDVLEEEATEDIEVMAGISPTDKPYMKTGVFETWRKRIPWLLLLMVSATFTSTIITHYEASLSLFGLAAFMPMLMDTGGNAGGQASVTVIRGLSLGEIRPRDWFKIAFKEFRVSILCGITMAAATFLKLMIVDAPGVTVALVVSLTLLCGIMVAKFVGCTMPILAKLIGLDPAVMASPFITTMVDVISLMIYFNIATAILV